MTPAPRYFWRRVLAFLVDHTLALLVVGLLSFPFIDTLGLRLPYPFLHLKTGTCTQLETAPDWFPPHTDESTLYSMTLCERRLFGIPNGRDLSAIYVATIPGNGAPVNRFLTVAVGPDLQPLPFPDVSNFAVIVLLWLGSAFALARWGRTPGKALAGLAVTGTGAGNTLLREGLRLAPLIAFHTISLALSAGFLMPLIGWTFQSLVIGVALVLLVPALWYALPLLRWRGTMPWDRWAGTTVVRR